MSLTTIESQAITAVSVQLQPFVRAKYQSPVKSLSDHSLATRINVMVTQAITDMGHKVDDKVLANISSTLERDLRAPKYAHLSFDEIELFVRNGVRGEYPTKNGQLLAINVHNIHHWIKCGLDDERRKRAIDEYHDAVKKHTEKPVVLDETWWLKAAKKMFEDYRSKTWTQDVLISDGAAAAIYDFLNKRNGVDLPKFPGKKTLVPDPDARKKITAMAYSDYPKVKQAIIKASRGAVTAEEVDYGNALPNLLKRHLLAHYFDTLINEGRGV